jgi:hypothetical protein
MGLKPLEPGFKRFELRPQLGDLEDLDLTAFTIVGPVALRARGKEGQRELVLQLPPNGEGELVLPEREAVSLPASSRRAPAGYRRFRLPSGAEVRLQLKFA